MILNINRKIILLIAFLPLVISLASIDYSDTAVEESFKVLVTVAGVEEKCGEELKITIAQGYEF